jgi:hypothetical protein
VIFSDDHKDTVLQKAHDELGHQGAYTVYELIKAQFYWPMMRQDAHWYVASCDECQKRCLKKMQIMPTVSAPVTLFQKVYVDIMYF